MLERNYFSLLGSNKTFVKGGPETVSHETKTSLNLGSFNFLGKVKRRVDYKERAMKSEIVGNFMEKNNTKIDHTYAYCNANKAAELPSVAKYDRAQPTVNEAVWTLSGQWMQRHFECMQGSGKLSQGMVLSDMDMNTSPGYPWSLAASNKRQLIEKIPKFTSYIEEMNQRIAKVNYEPDYDFFWTSSVKAEMRPHDKAILNKLRTFCASPMDLTMLSNMLNLDMNNRFYQAGANNSVWSAVGMSKYNLGWSVLGKRLERHPNGFALDISAYDASLFERSMWEICEFRITCGNYSGEDATRMRNLYKSIIHSVMVLTNGDVVQKSTGNPSGSGNTVVDNTLHLFRLLAYVWILLCPDDMRTYESFMANVEAALYGDDNTFTCSDEVVDWFNAINIKNVLATLDVKVTAENDVWTPQSLDKLVFLGQSFKKYYDHWMPVPDYNKTLCSLLYAGECQDPRWVLLRATALRQESFWNDELRVFFKDFIHSIKCDFRRVLDIDHNGEVYKGITYREILATEKSDETIRALYLSPESISKEASKNGHPLLSFVPCVLPLINYQSMSKNAKGPIQKVLQTAKAVENRAVKTARGAAKTARDIVRTVMGSPNRVSSAASRRKDNNRNASAREPVSMAQMGGGAADKFNRRSGRQRRGRGSGSNSTLGTFSYIDKEEIIGQLTSNQNFTTKVSELISVTNSYIFPIATQLARLYETVEFEQFTIGFRSDCGYSTAVQQQGFVTMGIMYDPDDPTPTSYALANDYSGFKSGPTFKNLQVHMDKRKVFFTKQLVSHAGGEDNIFDAPGRVLVYTSGQPSDGNIIGELYVKYKLKLGVLRTNNVSLNMGMGQISFFNASAGWTYLYNTGLYDTVKSGGYPLITTYNYRATNLGQSHIDFVEPGDYLVSITMYSQNATHAGVFTLVTGSTLKDDPAAPNWIGGSQITSLKTQSGGATLWVATVRVWVPDQATFNDPNRGVTNKIYMNFSNVTDATLVSGMIQVTCVSTSNSNSFIPSVSAKRNKLDILENKFNELQEKLALINGDKIEGIIEPEFNLPLLKSSKDEAEPNVRYDSEGRLYRYNYPRVDVPDIEDLYIPHQQSTSRSGSLKKTAK